MGKSISLEKEILKDLRKEKSISGIDWYVFQHASYLKNYHAYPEAIVWGIYEQYKKIRDDLNARGLEGNQKAIEEFRNFSVITVCALEYCRPGFPVGEASRVYYSNEFEKLLNSPKWKTLT